MLVVASCNLVTHTPHSHLPYRTPKQQISAIFVNIRTSSYLVYAVVSIKQCLIKKTWRAPIR